MKIVFLFIFNLIVNILISQVSDIKWIKTAIGPKEEWPRVVKTDLYENVYIIGEFTSRKLVIDGNCLNNTSDSTINADVNIFIAKYSKDGILIWTKTIQSEGDVGLPRIDIGSKNRIAVSFDASLSTNLYYDKHELIFPANVSGIVILYLDTNGELMWYKSLIDNYFCVGTAGIKIDKNEEIILGGMSYSGTIKDQQGNILLEDSIKSIKLFLIKLDKSGRILWAKSFGSEFSDYFSSITVDNSSNIIAFGGFNGYEFIVDNYKIINRGKKGNIVYPYDIFLAKIDPNGATLWLSSIYGKGFDGSADKIVTDNFGNIYTIGIFDSDSLFFNNSAFLTRSKPIQLGWDLFYSKYDPNGQVLWAKKIDNGVVGQIDFVTLTSNSNGQLYLSGNYDNTAFNSGKIILPHYGLNDIFYFECDNKGEIISQGSFGSDDHEWITDIHIDDKSNLYLLGNYSSNELKLGNSTLYNTSKDQTTDLYLIKINSDSLTSTKNILQNMDFNLVYNPENQTLKIEGGENLKFYNLLIFNISGQKIYARECNNQVELIQTLNLSSGIYFCTLNYNNGTTTKRFIIN